MAALATADEFFTRKGPVFQTMRTLCRRLESRGVSYAVAGGMAQFIHGHRQLTMNVDVLVTPTGLAEFRQQLDAFDYVPSSTSGKTILDKTTNVPVKFLITGKYPGDGKPKPVAFPDPAQAYEEIDGIRFLRLPTLIELKLASGLTGGVTRLKDLADVVALIQILKLNKEFANQLDPYVRDKYLELCQGIQDTPALEP